MNYCFSTTVVFFGFLRRRNSSILRHIIILWRTCLNVAHFATINENGSIIGIEFHLLMFAVEIQKLWNGTKVDGVDEQKIEEYLIKHGIASMADAGLKKIVSIDCITKENRYLLLLSLYTAVILLKMCWPFMHLILCRRLPEIYLQYSMFLMIYSKLVSLCML